MRLVPDQDPDEVHQQLISYFEENAPDTIKLEIKYLVGSPASISDRNSEGVKAMQDVEIIIKGHFILYIEIKIRTPSSRVSETGIAN